MGITRRWFELVGVTLILVVYAGNVRATERNIILFVTDDQSQTMGCYGDPVIRTPNLDQLAKEGTRFRYAFATTASCSASRSVILTGLHNHANGHYGHAHHFHKFNSYDNVISLPRMLKAAGYRTGIAGKHHLAPPELYPFDTKIRRVPRHPIEMVENCREFIESDDPRPFFLYFATWDPHRSGQFASEHAEQPDRFGNPPLGQQREGIRAVTYDPKDVTVPGFLPDTPATRAELAQYYQSISRVDQGVGRLIQMLKDADKWSNTLILFISDHGMAFPGAKTTVYDGGLRSPCLVRNPYDQHAGCVCDAMISWTDITPTILDFAQALDPQTGELKSSLVEKINPLQVNRQRNTDLTAGQFHGRSFLNILSSSSPRGWDEVYASHTFHEIQMYYPMRVVRERQYKLIWNIAHPLPFPFASDLWVSKTWQAQYAKGLDANYGQKTIRQYIHRPPFELYDVSSDPHEGNNLATDARYQETLERLKKKLKVFQRQTQDPWIMKWEYE